MGRFGNRLNAFSRDVSNDIGTVRRIVVMGLMPDSGRKAVEDAWLVRLTAVRARYRELREERARNGRKHAPALQKENEVLREYKRVLTLFTDLIMHGIVPGRDRLEEASTRYQALRTERSTVSQR